MPFLIETWDRPSDQVTRASVRAAHLTFLTGHAPLLLACGAKLHDDGTDAGGGVYIIDVDSRAEAEAFIAADPYTAAGLFARWEITRWRKGFVAGQPFIDAPAGRQTMKRTARNS